MLRVKFMDTSYEIVLWLLANGLASVDKRLMHDLSKMKYILKMHLYIYDRCQRTTYRSNARKRYLYDISIVARELYNVTWYVDETEFNHGLIAVNYKINLQYDLWCREKCLEWNMCEGNNVKFKLSELVTDDNKNNWYNFGESKICFIFLSVALAWLLHACYTASHC